MKGCSERQYPCGIWINCNIYKSLYIKKWKHYRDSRFTKDLHDWYDMIFRLKYDIPDMFPNG